MKTPQRYISEVPTLLNEWDWEKNKDASPYSIGYASTKKVWWKCKKCGCRWEAVVQSRTMSGFGCPECGKINSKETERIRFFGTDKS